MLFDVIECYCFMKCSDSFLRMEHHFGTRVTHVLIVTSAARKWLGIGLLDYGSMGEPTNSHNSAEFLISDV